ncbi:MAG: prefoldin subunit alpha [Thermoprotei archaeon]|nr:MAG: prefoldin subunit alpha [Thermoprotei archaeon]RLF00491.1 MAG: prefoldin subunit alpha [Thermoprotei archaeon]
MSKSELTREDIRRLTAEYILLQNLIREIEQRINVLNTTLSELMTTRQTVEEVSKLKEGHQLIVSIGSDVYLEVKVDKTNKFLVNLGAGTIVERPAEDTLRIIDTRIEDLRKALQDYQKNYNTLIARLSQIREILERIPQS